MRRALLVALSVIAVLVAGTACARKPEPPMPPPPPPSTLDVVAQRGELRVCSTGDYRPFTHRDPGSGQWSGIDLDMATDLAGRLGVRMTVVPTRWPTLLDDLTAGRCDIAMAGVTVSMDLARRAAFSQPYLLDGKAPITRCADSARFQTIDQIDRPGVRALVHSGGTNESFARERLQRAVVTSYPDNDTIVDEIIAGRADVMITDSSETRWRATQYPGTLCAVNPDRPLSFAQKAYLLPRGDVVFQQYVDQWLRLAIGDGTYLRASRPWTG